MEFDFMPKRLIKAREKIEIIHKNQNEKLLDLCANEKLRELIMELVAIEEDKLPYEAYARSEKDIRMVAGYIPYNYYHVEMNKLFQIFSYRSNERICQILYAQWQNSYAESKCNNFMCRLLEKDENFIKVIESCHLNKEVFKDILQNEEIAIGAGRIFLQESALNHKSLEENFAFHGMYTDSSLYKDCAFLFFTYCNKYDYISVDKKELLNIVKKYVAKNVGILKIFLKNFLCKLQLRDLISFYDLAEYLPTIVGEIKTKKFQTFFEKFDFKLKSKYIDWINSARIKKYFGEDERSKFWMQYRCRNVNNFPYSNAIIMEFTDYYAVEFLGKAMGPLYIYNKEYFEKWLIRRFGYNNNSKMRKELYEDKKWFYREEHRGEWQWKVNRELLNYKVTEKIL